MWEMAFRQILLYTRLPKWSVSIPFLLIRGLAGAYAVCVDLCNAAKRFCSVAVHCLALHVDAGFIRRADADTSL